MEIGREGVVRRVGLWSGVEWLSGFCLPRFGVVCTDFSHRTSFVLSSPSHRDSEEHGEGRGTGGFGEMLGGIGGIGWRGWI